MFLQLSSSDDDFEDPKKGSSKNVNQKKSSMLSSEDIRKQKLRERVAKSRAKRTDEQKQIDANASAERMKKSRANQSAEKQQIERESARQRMARLRLPTLTQIKLKDGLKSQDVLNGTFRVADLAATPDSIGSMDNECEHCGALKFRKEASSSCCSGGKVLLTQFPRPPEELMKLWKGHDSKSRMLRQHSRMFNNALCLSSLKVNLKTFRGFTPSIVFQGRVQHRAGALLPAEGELPKFAQLYIYDPALETNQRFENMVVPSSLSRSQKVLLKDLLKDIQTILHEVNPFVRDFKQIIDMPENEIAEGRIVITAKTPVNEHARRYNAPTNLQEVSVLMEPGKHDLVIERRGGGLQTISDLNPKGMPMHFTLLFPFGTYGWDPESKHAVGNRRVSTREYYAFHLNVRHGDHENFLHMTCKLFQEWICTSWVHVENQRLNYQNQNQKALRADSYKNVKQATDERMRELVPREDGLYNDDHQTAAIGRKILASSFTGSPRWYNAKFQDGMAICREFHKPDYFVTMTCNPHWPEIQNELLEGQAAQDRPDLVAKVFKLKKDQLLRDLTDGNLLGEVVAYMHVTEFQKRGLPHEHILIINAAHDRPGTSHIVDTAVVAELPQSPDDIEDPEVKAELKRLEDIVLTNMIHGPCGTVNPSSPCMENGRCTKGFPKEYVKKTIVDPDSYYATYMRRSPEDGGRSAKLPKGDRTVDNAWVIPYNPVMSLRYNCHINIECCASPKATKYLFKYVTKGNDRAMVTTEVDGQPRDEIAEYQDLRCVGSSEASWHLLNFPITGRYPSVMALRVHLKDQQQIVFDANSELEALESQRNTELTAFFDYNKEALDGGLDKSDLCRYVDMPKNHVYNKSTKKWRRRKRGDKVIGRVHSINPIAGEAFYLRVLLHNDHCVGKTSFGDMLILPGKICETYKEVCCELGLLNDDREWQRILEEAAGTNLCPQIREMYVIILQFCMPSDPFFLFNEFWRTWKDDFEMQAQKRNQELSEEQLRTMVLLDIELRLQSFEKSLEDFGLPVPTAADLAQVETMMSIEPAVIREELDFQTEELSDTVQQRIPTFTEEQRLVFETVMDAVRKEEPLTAFIDARGGCGKTYLLNTILAAVRSLEPQGCTALAMATTGIAANLLELGRTFHSRMKAPLTPTENSTLAISGQSQLAHLIRISRLLLIDESTMLDRYMLEALDRTLRDITDNQDTVFGGKILILAGDFRQCLPVVPGATRAGTVAHCINQSPLWSNFKILRLTKNMRVHASGDQRLEKFDRWTLSLGNGDVELAKIPDEMVVTKIIANSKENTLTEGQAMEEFIKVIFPNIEVNIRDRNWLDGRAILCTTNKEVAMINETVSSLLPGVQVSYASADELQNTDDLLRFNVEYLNSLTPTGFPPHVLLLKPGMPLMLMRNINPREGLCNGTKLVFEKALDNKLLQCMISGSNRTVLIPRIIFIPKQGEYPFDWHRRQFPVKPAFATTINKSQGK